MSNTHSFSFIEILVVASIVSLFSGLVLAAYYSLGQAKNLEKETQKIVDILEQAKAKTASGDSSLCTPQATSNVDTFSFSVLNSTNYQLRPNCTSGTAVPINFQTGNNVTFVNPPVTIQFYRLTNGASSGCIKLRLGSNCRYIQVSNQSIITENKATSCSSCP